MIGRVVEARAGVPDRLEVSLRLVQRAAEDRLPLRQEVQMAEKAEDLFFKIGDRLTVLCFMHQKRC